MKIKFLFIISLILISSLVFSEIDYSSLGSSVGEEKCEDLIKKAYYAYLKNDINTVLTLMVPLNFAREFGKEDKYKKYLEKYFKNKFSKIKTSLLNFNFPSNFSDVQLKVKRKYTRRMKLTNSEKYLDIKIWSRIYVIYNGRKIRLIRTCARFNGRWYIIEL